MSKVDPRVIEKYQLQLDEDPQSLAFAPLVDAYRHMGWLNQAVDIGLSGVRANPKFSRGRIALARVLIERVQLEPAIKQLKEAIKYSPDNLLAFNLLADCLVKLKRPKESLKAFKMILFLDPKNEKAATSVKKLESLTADEYEDELFEMIALEKIPSSSSEIELLPIEVPNESQTQPSAQQVDRVISLVDAFIVRNEFERALNTLSQASLGFDDHPEIQKRFSLLQQLQETLAPPEKQMPIPSRKQQYVQNQIQYLNLLLARIHDRARS